MSSFVTALTRSRILESARARVAVARWLVSATGALLLVACSGDERESLPPTANTGSGALAVRTTECCADGEHRTEIPDVEQAPAHTETSAGFPIAVPAPLPDPSLRLTAVTIHKPRFGDTTSEVNLVYTVPGEGVPPRTRLSIVQLGPDHFNNRQHWPIDTEEVDVGSSRVRIDPGPSGGHFFMVVDGKLQVRSTGIPRDAVVDMIEELLAAEARLS